MKPHTLLPCLGVIGTLLTGPTVSAAVIWSENFEDDTVGNPPTSNYPGGAAGNDWSANTITAGLSHNVVDLGGNKAVFQSDNTTGSSILTVNTSQFAPFSLNSTTNILRLSFDFRVDSLLSTAAGVNPRLILRTGSATGNGYVVGFSRSTTNIDGDASTSDLGFYIAPHGNGTSTVSGASAGGVHIGLSGGAWASGFDFGDYSATSADNNTNGNFYRFVVEYDFSTGALTGSATNLANLSESTTFSTSMNSGVTFAGSTADMLLATGTNNGTSVIAGSDSYIDNILVEVIPEPSSILLAGGGLVALAARRRRTA